jgi:radical SAM superfamily enzyme YgiQ (UPF0313 family)
VAHQAGSRWVSTLDVDSIRKKFELMAGIVNIVNESKTVVLIVTMVLKDVEPGGDAVETEATAISVFRYLVHLLRNFAMTDPELAEVCEIRGLQINGTIATRVDLPSFYSAAMPLFSKSQWHYDIACSIAEHAPKVVGFNSYVWNVKDLLLVSYFLKALLKDVVIVFGGPECYEVDESRRMLGYHRQISAIVRGEGEISFRDLLRFYLLGKGDLDQIPFLTYRKGRGVVESSSTLMLKNLDDIPSAVLSQIPSEIVQSNVHFPHISMAISRGCPIGCKFCMFSAGLIENTQVRTHSKERIIEELKFLRHVGVQGIDFLDATFAAQKDLVVHILRYLLDEYVTCKVAFEQKLDAMHSSVLDLVEELMRQGRIAFLDVGLQSTNEKALKLMSRRNNLKKLEDNLRKMAIASAGGSKVPTCIDLMAGLPGDDFAGYLGSIDYVVNYLRLEVYPSAQFFCAPLAVIPGTAFRRDAEELGLVYEPVPPYTVFSTNTNSARDIRRSKSVIQSLLVLGPVLQVLHDHEIPTRGVFHEIFTDEYFVNLEALGWDNPLSHLFAVTRRLGHVFGAKLEANPNREVLLERIEYLYAVQVSAHADRVHGALLQVPSLVSSPFVRKLHPSATGVADMWAGETFRPLSPIDGAHVFRFAHGRALGLLDAAASLDESVRSKRFVFDFHERGVETPVAYLAISGGRVLAFSEWSFEFLQRLYSGDAPLDPGAMQTDGVSSQEIRATLIAFSRSGLLHRN